MTHNNPQNTPRLAKFRHRKTLGTAMLLLGALTLTLVGGYYAYSVSARSQLGDLNYVVSQSPPVQSASHAPQPASPSQPALRQPPTQQQPKPSLPSQSVPMPSSGNGAAASLSVLAETVATEPVSVASPPRPAQQSFPAAQEPASLPPSSFTALYPGTRIHPKFWAHPIWSGGEPYAYSPAAPDDALPQGFRVVSAADDALRRGQGALTSRISIPLIGVDSETKELAILNLGDSRAYETPKHLVGHIPQSPNPGELGNAWYFGHLESPIKGEGNVFHRLPEIPDLLRDGDDVFVELESADGRVFLYKATRTEVIHQDRLELYGSDTAQLTLVACVPRFVYDHRIVVTAELVGIKDERNALN